MKALVLSGGGGKAAYQVGALQHWIKEQGRTYDIFCGSSAGALNAAFLATEASDSLGLEKLTSIWEGINPRSIYKPWSYSFLGPLGGILLGKPSLYDSRPLHSIVHNNIHRSDLIKSGKKLSVGAVCLSTAEYKTWRETDTGIIQAIKASSAYPGAFIPVQVDGKYWIDAGTREFTPMSAALSMGATEIDVICLSSRLAPQFTDFNPTPISMYKRALDILMFRLDLWDLDALYDRYAGVTIRVLSPSTSLGSFINFDPANIRRLYQQGYKEAVALG